ncbi:response regulator [Agaribacter flavus]|uniref:PleD family two-component system response regulator n=1 Tax=Agaribacter flavus TaxID=1902781 RepID=A0ABV7FM08_9ALTE
MNKQRVLLVDDSPNELRILMQVLKHQYAIVVATSGEQAIEMIKEDEDIELVLLDVNMPNMDGYDTCTAILAIRAQLPIVFVSANDSTEEILKGFDVGGVDYLTKPIDKDIVARKVDKILLERKGILKLQDEHKSTSDMVMSVIANAGQLGTVLGFLRAGLKVKSHDALVSALFDVFDGLNMDVCVQLQTPQGAILRSSSSVMTALESDLLSRASKMSGRFLERGTRYIVNFDHVAILVKNMPEDPNTRGDLRDNLMMILEDTDALCDNLCKSNTGSLAVEEAAHLREELIDTATTMDMLAKQYEQNKANLVNIFEDINVDFETAFFKLGLMEQQEQTLTEIVSAKTALFGKSMETSIEIEEAIFSLQERMQDIVKSFH